MCQHIITTHTWFESLYSKLTHWGQVTHIYISNITIIGSDNGLSPGQPQAIIWPSAGILLIGRLGTNFSEISIEIHTFSFKEMHLKMSSAKWLLFCLDINVLKMPISAPIVQQNMTNMFVMKNGLWKAISQHNNGGLGTKCYHGYRPILCGISRNSSSVRIGTVVCSIFLPVKIWKVIDLDFHPIWI